MSPAMTKWASIRKPALQTRIVMDVLGPRDVVGPEPDLVRIAGPVPVFSPVEDGRGGVAYKKVHDRSIDAHGDVPMALGGQAENLERLVGIERGAVGCDREPGLQACRSRETS